MQEMLQGIDRFRCCYIVIKILILQKNKKTVKRSPHTHHSKLNTADGCPMSALGMTALHLRIAEFKFTHNFIICDQFPDTELIFGIDIQKSFLFPMLGPKKRTVTFQKKENS